MGFNAVEQLEQAFRSAPIDAAPAFAEWGGYLDAPQFRESVNGRRWTELDAAFLERHHDAMVFFGPSSIATYLPAYLAVMVRRDPALDVLPRYVLDVLTRSLGPERFDERFAQLTTDQRRAVAVVLENFERELDGSSRQADVRTALDDCWRSQLGGAS